MIFYIIHVPISIYHQVGLVIINGFINDHVENNGGKRCSLITQ